MQVNKNLSTRTVYIQLKAKKERAIRILCMPILLSFLNCTVCVPLGLCCRIVAKRNHSEILTIKGGSTGLQVCIPVPTAYDACYEGNLAALSRSN